jgi:hypothetical protein
MRRARWPTLVCLVVAAALYASAAVLDETVIDAMRRARRIPTCCVRC